MIEIPSTGDLRPYAPRVSAAACAPRARMPEPQVCSSGLIPANWPRADRETAALAAGDAEKTRLSGRSGSFQEDKP